MNTLRKWLATASAVIVAMDVAAMEPARATPATLGFYPATDIYGDKIFHFDVDRYSVDDFKGSGNADTYGLTYGLGDQSGAFGRNEIGFDYYSNSGLNLGKSLSFNAKTQLYDDDARGVRVVGGVWLAGNADNALVSNTGYLLASKAFKFGRLHLGLAHAFSDKNIGADAADTTFLQLGYDRALSKKVVFAADYYSGKSLISGVQPTLYYAVNDRASFGIGYFFCNEPRGTGFNNDQLYLCFDLNFGGPQTAPLATGAPASP